MQDKYKILLKENTKTDLLIHFFLLNNFYKRKNSVDVLSMKKEKF